MNEPVLERQIIQNQNELEILAEDLEKENNTHLIIDPVLLDISNRHEILRNMARQDLQDYTEKMVNQMNKGKKRIREYQIGDLVRVAISKIDRCSVDHPTLEPLETASFPELDNIPSNKRSCMTSKCWISIRKYM